MVINRLTYCKFLGIILHNKMPWKPNPQEEVWRKFSKFAYALYSLVRKVKSESAVVAYYSMIALPMRFGVIFWGNYSERKSIFRSQNMCISAMCELNTQKLAYPCLFRFNINLALFCIFSGALKEPPSNDALLLFLVRLAHPGIAPGEYLSPIVRIISPWWHTSNWWSTFHRALRALSPPSSSI